MIGGHEVVIPAVADAAALEACARIVQHYWPHVRFEDAETGDKYDRYGEIPFGRVRELLAYPDANAEAAWDAERADAPPNSMIYFLLSPQAITAVVDDPTAGDARPMFDSIKTMLWQDIVNTYARAA